MLNQKIMMTVMASVALVISGCHSNPVVTQSRPVCSPYPYPELPYVPDSELRKLSPDSREHVYEIVDKLTNWGTVNESIIRQVCES